MRGSEGPPPAASAISAVLSNDDLLREILLRLGFPTTLVRAAAVAKRWLRHASDPAFLSLFRDRHPRALLGFYLREALFPRPRFVSVSQAPELAAAVRLAGSITVTEEKFYIQDCRNGRLLLCDLDCTGTSSHRQQSVLSPLHPTRGKLVVPPPMPLREPYSAIWSPSFLPDEDGNGDTGSMEVLAIGTELRVRLLTLQSGVWIVQSSSEIHVPQPVPVHVYGYMLPPVCRKIFIPKSSEPRHILKLDMAAASCSILQLPDGLTTDNFKLSRGENGSGLILVHAEGYLLSIWRLAANSDDVNGWELVYDRIPVREAFNRREDITVIAVDDTIEFVFLGRKVSRAVICMHLRSRTEKAYDGMVENMFFVEIFPFKMVWPPTFPALEEENNQEEE
ncbi:unnamed protein product [Urochloa decumbens]|uniref:F-box protein AT5G49610-like beta-propeller domain-containing protein n=1 Tax=Urochloa decumbens TaxID=240449 RepID=A0ABC9CLV8_9POAL